jgi:antirestriction protein ArdC
MSKPLSTNSRADTYQRVTDAIVLNLEQGVRPWIKPWTASAGNTTRPLRHDGTPYRGINILILWSEAAARGYASSTWMTYRQATVLGGQVRKGEHGTTVVYANVIERSDKASQAGSASADQIATTRIPVLRAYTVFNVDQLDGLPGTATSRPLATNSLSGRIERADAFVMACGATIVHRGNRACYVPSTDRIEMPPYGQFVDTRTASAAEGYYATLLHELVHNAVIGIMPHGTRWRLVCLALAMRQFGIIRALPGMRGADHRAGSGSTEWQGRQRGRAPSPSTSCRRGCRSGWSRRSHDRARVRSPQDQRRGEASPWRCYGEAYAA